jgi:hypothetical protein
MIDVAVVVVVVVVVVNEKFICLDACTHVKIAC